MWTPKLFYGIISDTFTICGSRKKSYFILFAAIQMISAYILAFFETRENYHFAVVCLSLIQLSQAFMDVIADGLMVSQQKMDPENGSEDLQLLSWISYGVGGTVFGICGGVFLEYYSERLIFFLTGFLGLILLLSAICLNPALEKSHEKVISMSLFERVKFNFWTIYQALKVRALIRIIIFVIILGGFVPSFNEYLYAYEVGPLGFSQL